ncbi:MAG: asparagine synthase (glutamine-hydrolyzing) [Patescibacteria group bacterium]
MGFAQNMCGIAGEVRFDGRLVSEDQLKLFSLALAHRGPDGEGMWRSGSVGLMHRRLALVDLSPTGAQPMKSADEKFVITFNGEIYNYQELRAGLERDGVTFRSTSDTEVLLHLYTRDGERMLEHLHGMFAFALWDAEKKTLFFARDRIGKKPFFYHVDDRSFTFASELKAILEKKPTIDWMAVRTFLGLQYVPSPSTGFEGYVALPPGHCGTVTNARVTVRRYDQIVHEPTLTISYEEAVQETRRLLSRAVEMRMIADVPVGSFLSGGIDSSVITAMAVRASQEPVHTFTMGFPSMGFDERVEAQWFADQLGTTHHVFEARPEEVVNIVDDIIRLYDAPYADSSAIPSWLLCRETSRTIKAVLAGDGGDELFGGYRRYQYYLRAQQFRRYGLGGIGSLASGVLASVLRDPRYTRFARLLKAMGTSSADGYASIFTGAYFSREDEERLLLPAFQQQTQTRAAHAYIVSHFSQSLGAGGMMDFDLTQYLPDDLNVKMDRASMAHGLEVRCPLLDQELVAFVARLPIDVLLKQGSQKPLLKDVAKGLVPEEVFTRPKRGFQVPLAEWFRGPLRMAFIERCLLKESPLKKIMDLNEVRRYFDENDGGVDHGNRLWMLFVLSSWLQIYG